MKLRMSWTYFLRFMKSKKKITNGCKHLTHTQSITYKVLLYKVSVLHPEDSLAAAMGHQLVTEVLRPVGPLIGPAAVPGETTPGVTEPQQPAVE